MTDSDRKRQTITWSFEKEIDAIDFYKDHPALWNPKIPDYFNRALREVSLSKLVEGLGSNANGVSFTAKDVKEKFKNLRTTYSREVKRTEISKKSGSATEDVYQSRWGHYRRMSFLKDPIKAGKSQDTLETEQQASTSSSPAQTEVEEVTQKTKCVTPPPKKRKSDTSRRQTLMEEAIRVLQAPEPKPTDGEDYFSQHVAASLRNLTPYAREHAKLEIQQVLLKYCVAED